MSLIANLPAAFGRSLPVILQTEATECGLACLGMVSGYHGCRTDLAQLRRQFSISQHGATLGQLIGIANALGLASRPLRLDLEDLGQLRTPCILHWNLNHFVVLKKVARRGILIHDPASGARWVARDEISRSFTGVALELWPSAEFRPSAAPPAIRFRDLIGRVDGLFSAATQVLILAAALEVFALASPFYLQWVIDHVLVSADRDLLTTLALGFGLLLIVQQLFSALRSWILLHIGTNLSLQWRTNVFAHLLRLPVQYFEKRHLGDVVSRFGAVDEIQRKLTASFFSVLIDGVMSAVTLAMMFLYSPALAWMAVAAMLTYALIRALWFRPLRLATEQEIVHHASQQSHFLETVRGIKAVKLFQRQNERRSGWVSLVAEQVNAGVRTQRLFIAFESINGLLFGLVGIAILWLGAKQTLDGLMTVGVLMAFKAYKDQFDGRVASLRRSGGEAPRALIGTVMQDDTLFAGSIADNICFFDPAPDRARIEECARLAQIHEEIAAMAMGYHTLVGDMGTVLSGGQKQRLFLARALYKQPRILVLDEATSHLDVACEQAVNAAIQSLDLTRIIIAHRPETILSAERVVMLHGGKVVEDMPVSELVARQAAATTAQTAEAG